MALPAAQERDELIRVFLVEPLAQRSTQSPNRSRMGAAPTIHAAIVAPGRGDRQGS
jgi:hypothetical protein